MVSPWAPWVVIAIVAFAAAAGWWIVWNRRRRRVDETHVANTGYLETLPSFKKRLAMHRVAALGLTSLVGVSTLFTALLAGRPVDIYTTNEQMASRDIVLCLDVSGSMFSFDSAVMDVYSEMVEAFDGERVGLNIWNSTTRVVFPLSDDYAMIQDELEYGSEVMGTDYFSFNTSNQAMQALDEWIAGTWSDTAAGSSLIGDGLASCVLAFDAADKERSRTIILATDNEVSGTSVFSLQEAGELAAERDVRIHAIYASEFPSALYRDEYEQVVRDNGGLFYELGDPSAAEAIVDEITSQQLAELDAAPETHELDRPDRFYPWLVLFVAGLVAVAWRTRS